MLDKSLKTELHITQSQLNHSHSQLLECQAKIEQLHLHIQANQAETTNDNEILYTLNNQDKDEETFDKYVNLRPEAVKIKSSNFTVEEKRVLVISRLQMSKTCQTMGVDPWTSITNDKFNNCDAPCISVIVTLFNYSKYICECLNSVSKSDIANIQEIELLVIDDCSTDNSVSIVEEYLQESEVPTCLIKKWFNTGLADARNVGLKIARSPYVFILDADNWIHPNCLDVLYSTIKYSDYAAVYGVVSMFHNETKEEINRISCDKWNVNQLVRKPYIDAMAMFNKNIVNKLGGYSTELIEYGWFGWEDYDLWLKLAQSNYPCKFVPEVLSSYRVHCTSMINTTNQYALNLARYFHKKFADLILKHEQLDMFFGYSQTEIYSSENLLPIQQDEQLKLQELQALQELRKLQEIKAKFIAMQSSKFWLLRNQWFKFKKSLGLVKNTDIIV
ncbi:MAG: glycosyltransferase family A protein [Rhizonema sp. PD38]|nr:glycosyltransferase family A protein [Rhizonema sp. PD38]